MKNTKIISSCLQGLLCGRGGIRGFYFRPDGSRWPGEHLQMSFPVCDKSYAGDDQGQGKSGIEYRDEGVRKQMKPSDGHSQGNHECHDAPSLEVEKGKRTVLVTFLCNPPGVFQVQFPEDENGKKQKDQCGFCELGKQRLLVFQPAGDSDMKDIASGDNPDEAGNNEQGIP